ncbi:hypothetical protein ATN89_10980, partial [Comamonas thiooxydans]
MKQFRESFCLSLDTGIDLARQDFADPLSKRAFQLLLKFFELFLLNFIFLKCCRNDFQLLDLHLAL